MNLDIDINLYEDDEEDLYDPHVFSTFEYKKKSRYNKYICMLRSCKRRYVEIKQCVRSITLLKSIRQRILSMQQNRLPKLSIVKYIQNKFKKIEQVEEQIPLLATPESGVEKSDEKGISNIQSSSASNVIVTYDRDSDVASQPPQLYDKWTELCSSDILYKPTVITDRWVEVKQFNWSTTDVAQLWTLDLPLDLIMCDNDNIICGNKPVNSVFKNFMYYKSDIEVKIQVNANKFQLGQLIIGWFYGTKHDNFVNMRYFPTQLSQTIHGFVTANTNNELTIKIPYNAHVPYLNTRNFNYFSYPLLMGKLICYVLSPLTTSNSGPSSCSGTVLVRLVNAQFTGMISTNYGSKLGEFEGPIGKVVGDTVGSVVSSFLGEPNRDNPPDPRPPQILVPTASHSWSIGTGLSEPLTSLRLDGRGQVPHPYVNTEDEMLISYIANKSGYIKTILWSKDDPSGTLLFQCDAAPFIDKHIYSTRTNNNMNHSLVAYDLPPIAVISSLFNYWRGMIKFRFDFVSSCFHTGRILFAYVPGVERKTVMTLGQVKNSAHVIFTLNEQQSFTFEIPYIANKPFWPRQYTGGVSSQVVRAPSQLYVFVLNPLIPMESVASSLYINVYMSGGTDFEVAVPVQPNIGLCFNSTILYSTSEAITALSGYSPYYFGTYYGFLDSKGLCARDAATSGKVSYFDNKFEAMYAGQKNKAIYYELYDVNAGARIIDSNKHMITPKYSVLLADSNGEYLMCLPLNEEFAKDIAIAVKTGKNPKDFANLFYPVYDTTVSTYSNGNPLWIPHIVDINDDFILVSPESDDKQIISPANTVKTTSNGLLLFGERFISLKDLCRRYQLYCSLTISADNIKTVGQCAFNIPVLPQGLLLNLGDSKHIFEIFNRCRDGHIPIIASGYRYYRGGIRFRLILPATIPVTIWVQHRPDRKFSKWSVSNCKDINSAQGCMNHSYASYLQLTNVNGVVEFEIPYYSTNCQQLLQGPIVQHNDIDLAYTLGEIALGFVLTDTAKIATKDIVCQLYYSMADDMRFNTFQGFPPMVILDDIADEAPSVKCNPEGPFNFFMKEVKSGVKEVSKDIVNDVVNETIVPKVKGIQEVIDEIINCDFKKKISNFFSEATVRVIMSHIIHIVLNPEIRTVAWSICNIFVECGLLCVSALETFLRSIQKFLDTVVAPVSSQNQPSRCDDTVDIAVECSPESPNVSAYTSDNVCAAQGLLTAMWVALCTMLKVTTNMPQNLCELSKFLLTDITAVLRSSNVLFVFINNMVTVWEKMYNAILFKLYPKTKLMKELENAHGEIKLWAEEVLYLTSMEVASAAPYDVALQQRVYDAASFGAVLMVQDLDNLAPKMQSILNIYYKEITKLHDVLKNMGIDPHVRKLPFSVMCFGRPGIGKSHLVSDIISKMCKRGRITSKTGLMCVVNPTDKYWSQCDRQPALVMDDLYMIEEGEMLQSQIANVVALCSPVPFTPPMAALEDKKMRYNPDIVWMNTNKPFPRFDKYDMEAIYRRRDILVKIEHIDFEKESKPNCIHCENKLLPDKLTLNQQDLISDYHHLKFYLAKDVKSANTKYDGPYSYAAFEKIIVQKFIENRAIEHKKFVDRLNAQNDILFSLDQEDCTTISQKVAKYQSSKLNYVESLQQKTLLEFYNSCFVHWRQDYTQKIAHKFGKMLNVLEPMKLWNSIFDVAGAVPESNEMEDIDECITALEKSPAEILNSQPSYANLENYLQKNIDNVEILGICSLAKHLFDQDIINIVMFKELCLCISYELDHDVIVTYQLLNAILTEMEMGLVFNDVALYARTWDMVYQYLLDMYIKSKSVRQTPTTLKCKAITCHHLICDSAEMSVNSNGDFCNTDSVYYNTQPCEYGEFNLCIMNSSLMCRVFIKRWLNARPIRRLQYARKQYHFMPKLLRDNRDWLEFPEMQSWASMCKSSICNFYDKYLSVTGKKIQLFFEKIWPAIKIILQMCGIILATTGFTYGMTVMLEKQLAPVDVWAEAESHPYTNRVPITVTKGAVSAKQQSRAQQTDVAIKRIRENFFYLVAYCDGKIVEYTCLGLFNRTVLFLRHYLDEIHMMPDHTIFYGRYHNMPVTNFKYGIQFDFKSLKKNFYMHTPNNDGVVPSNFVTFTLPNCFTSQVKDITKFIATESDHSRVVSDMILVEVGEIIQLKGKRENIPYLLSSVEGITPVKMQSTYTYSKHGRGMCGSLLLSPNLNTPIIGMHVAGVDKQNLGIAEILTFEMFKPLECKKNQFVEPCLGDIELSSINLETAIFPKGVLPSEVVLPQSRESRLVPSLLHGVFPVETEPNPLSAKDKRLPENCDPLKLGCEHLGKAPLDFPLDLCKNSADHYISSILPFVKPLRDKVGVLTMEEAILGFPNIEEYKDLEWNTSAGHPLRCLKKNNMAKGKRFLFDLEETPSGYKVKGIHPELVRLMNLDMSLRKQNIKPFTIFVDSLKDTTLPIDKCKIPGKTRVFSCSPIQFQIVFRMYFQDFMCAYRSSRFDSEHMIGIDPQSLEWTHLAKRLLIKNSKCVAGDYKNFGPGLMHVVAFEAKRIILSWYDIHGATAESQQIRSIMLDEIIDCYHLCQNFVYCTPCGIPSGSPITTELNSIVNSLYIRIIYQMILNKPLTNFQDHVTLYTYGDDLIMTISDDIINDFNLVTMSNKFFEYGIVFTDELKEAVMKPYKQLHDCSFLKRSFVCHPFRANVIVGPLVKSSVQGALNWIDRKNDPYQNTIDCARSVLDNSVEHGEEYFNANLKIIMQACNEKNIVCSFASYSSLEATRYG